MIAAAEQEANAVAADPFTARYLKLDVGAVLLTVKRLMRDSKDRIIEWTTGTDDPCLTVGPASGRCAVRRGRGRQSVGPGLGSGVFGATCQVGSGICVAKLVQ